MSLDTCNWPADGWKQHKTVNSALKINLFASSHRIYNT